MLKYYSIKVLSLYIWSLFFLYKYLVFSIFVFFILKKVSAFSHITLFTNPPTQPGPYFRSLCLWALIHLIIRNRKRKTGRLHKDKLRPVLLSVGREVTRAPQGFISFSDINRSETNDSQYKVSLSHVYSMCANAWSWFQKY